MADGWIDILVFGQARAAGSKRALPVRTKDGTVKHVVVDANKHATAWKQEVRSAAAQVYDGPLLTGPLETRFTFVRVRPKGHFRTGKHADLLRDSAPDRPTGKPDVLKLARGVEDALTGIIYRDDSQTVRLCAEKTYGDRDCVLIRIRALPLGTTHDDDQTKTPCPTSAEDLCPVSHHLA